MRIGCLATPAQRPGRDLRLDLFRGLTMFIIFIAHVPNNAWNDWIPARFGFSSGGELFVFCSGAASAVAFGATFLRRGFIAGTARIVFRMWQVYWAHVALFVTLAALAASGDYLMPRSGNFEYQFSPFIERPATALFAAMTLSWLPDYLDILPLYIVILAMVPAFMVLHRVHKLAPLACSFLLYLTVWLTGLALPASPFGGLTWFFNPFAWQFIFFTAFSFMIGWLPVPPLRHRAILAICVTFLVLSVPVCFWGIRQYFPVLQDFYSWLLPSSEKTDLHPLRYLHFLAVAYVTLSLIDPVRHRIGEGITRVIVVVGQQSLATFLTSIAMARVAWIMLDGIGRTPFTVAVANIGGFAGIIVAAYVVRWFKSEPWIGPARHASVPLHNPGAAVAPSALTRPAQG